MSEDEQTPDEVEEAAAHAASSVEHRREVQRQSAKAEAADGADEAALEREASAHEKAAEREEARADTAAREADAGSET